MAMEEGVQEMVYVGRPRVARLLFSDVDAVSFV